MADPRRPHDPRFRSGPPAVPATALPPVPHELSELLAGARTEQTWVKRESEVWRAELATGRAYLKLMDDLGEWAGEVERLRWCTARTSLPTPEVLGAAVDDDGRGWFVATEVLGIPSHDPALLVPDPSPLVDALALGLRRFHEAGLVEAAPSTPCPYRLTVADLVASAEARVAAGGVDPSSMRSATYRRLSPERLLELLVATQPTEPAADQVLAHGDPCQPNLLVDRGERRGMELTGMVDLGRLAVSDRYRDLAIATRSLAMNVDDAAAVRFLRSYGVDQVDQQRLEWWTLVDDMW